MSVIKFYKAEFSDGSIIKKRSAASRAYIHAYFNRGIYRRQDDPEAGWCRFGFSSSWEHARKNMMAERASAACVSASSVQGLSHLLDDAAYWSGVG